MYTSPSGGVAIRSSISSIRAALAADPPGVVPTEIYAGRVRYADYATVQIPDENAFWPVLHKRAPYAFEHEVRLVAWPRRLVEQAESLALGKRDWTEMVTDIAPIGYDVGVDPKVLIEAVVVAPRAPDWLIELVEAVAVRYGIKAPVIRSDLDAAPAVAPYLRLDDIIKPP
jgi:hypothetical protein